MNAAVGDSSFHAEEPEPAAEGGATGGSDRDGEAIEESAGGSAPASASARRKRRLFTWKRVLVGYLVLLAAHHLVVRVIQPDLWGAHQPVPADAERVDLTVPAFRGDGPVAGAEPVSLVAHRYTRETLADEAPAGEAESVPDSFADFASSGEGALPIVLLHGSPSQGARDFHEFAPPLASTGRTVYAIDRPGYGLSDALAPSYSVKANARYVLAALDELGVERAHLVGWSYSGAVVVHAAELAPERVASITLMGAMATQEGEGSGSYFFEHFKYFMGFPVVVGVPELIPHFGLLPPTDVRHAFVRDFWDTDLRPLRGIMEGLETPALIVHGRHDPLVPATTAELHHEVLPNSRLVMLDASHFVPLGPPLGEVRDLKIAAASIVAFASAHDEAGRPVREGVVDLSPAPPRKPFTLFGVEINPNEKWWLLVLFIVLGTFVSEDLTVIAVGLAVAAGALDPGVALMGCFLGIVLGDYGLWALGHFGGRRLLKWPFVRRVLTDESLEHWSKVLGRHTAKAVFLSRMLPGTRLPLYIAAGVIPRHNKKFLFFVTIAVAVWTPMLLLLTLLIGPPLLGFMRDIFHGPWAVIAAFVVLFVLLRIVSLEATDLGRQRLKAELRLFVEYEFWPALVFYAPLMPWLALLSIRYRSVTLFTATNPGLPNGGGFVGEPKTAICRNLERQGAPVLAARLIERNAEAEARLRQLRGFFDDPDCPLTGYPVILKPDAGQRGFGVRIIRSDEDALEYLDETTGPVQAQVLATQPNEVGVLWSRVPSGADGKNGAAGGGRAGAAKGGGGANGEGHPDELPGEIFSVTRKAFPVIEGDGEQTLEQLIWDHKRYRMQAKRFINRHTPERDRVLGEGERFQLAASGNHAQGAIFSDGADLITPELTAAIDRIARSYTDPATGAGLDFVRIDLRYESEEDLRRGRGFSIIELNGSASESTNLYDPDKNILFAYGVLFRQWARLYRLGALRRAKAGQKPLGPVRLVGLALKFYRQRRGDPVAD